MSESRVCSKVSIMGRCGATGFELLLDSSPLGFDKSWNSKLTFLLACSKLYTLPESTSENSVTLNLGCNRILSSSLMRFCTLSFFCLNLSSSFSFLIALISSSLSSQICCCFDICYCIRYLVVGSIRLFIPLQCPWSSPSRSVLMYPVLVPFIIEKILPVFIFISFYWSFEAKMLFWTVFTNRAIAGFAPS